eukprot:6588968-Pyramimonas_sp.AAC.1
MGVVWYPYIRLSARDGGMGPALSNLPNSLEFLLLFCLNLEVTFRELEVIYDRQQLLHDARLGGVAQAVLLRHLHIQSRRTAVRKSAISPLGSRQGF